MRPLDIVSLATVMPAIQPQQSQLGAAASDLYHHLYEPAGRFSRPGSVARGVLRKWSAVYDAPVAGHDERCSDLAAAAAHAAAAGLGGEGTVADILHAQCTLDQQILGSACLRLQAEVFPDAGETVAVGQAGTAGVAVALALADLIAAPGSHVAIAAADKWIAPFFRKRGAVPLADAAACCIAGRDVRAIARIVALQNLVGDPMPDFWDADEAAVEHHVAELAVAAIAGLRAKVVMPGDARIAGDAPGSAVAYAVAARAGLLPLATTGPVLHLGSAAMIAAISHGIAAAVATGAVIPLVVWTACPSGHAGAALVHCAPDAVATDHGWTLLPAFTG